MRKSLFCLLILGLLVCTSGWSLSVTVNKAGTGGAYTSINAALTAGATHITITDSNRYEENVILGDNDTLAGGAAVTITSDKTGDARPQISPDPAGTPAYDDSNSTSRMHGIQVFAPNSSFSNLIIEGNGDTGAGGMAIIAPGVQIENCLFRPRPETTGILGSSYPFLFIGSQGAGGNVATEGGRQCDNVIIRNCELNGIKPGYEPEPVNLDYLGYLSNTNCGASQLVRMDVVANDGATAHIVDVTFEDCLVHYSPDLHMFPSNRGPEGGQLIVYLKNCRMDAAAKMSIRGRGSCVVADHTVFTRTNQGNHGDGENSALAINPDNVHQNNFGSATDCIFVNCGSAFAKKAYYGGIHNAGSDGSIKVDHCTFDKCVTGLTCCSSSAGYETSAVEVTNSIFHRIGYQSEPAVDSAGCPLGATTPYDIPAEGLYKSWYWGLNSETPYFEASAMWSAVFNVYNSSALGYVSVKDTLVGTVADEDTRTWEEVQSALIGDASDVHGCRLDCGTVAADGRVRYLNTLTRGTPIFKNTDPDAEIPYELDSTSPGQGWGARFGSSSAIRDWSLYR